jgi:AbrB family looped-hinge helix DNA binding protein
MQNLVSSVSPKGQVTIPIEIRRRLGIKPKDKVAFRVDDGQVRLIPARFTLETAYGSVSPRHAPEDFEKMIDEAMEEHAVEVLREMRSK